MLPRILRRAPNGQQHNTGTSMISSVEVPSADPAEQPRIVAAAALRIHESAVLIHEAVQSVEEEDDQYVATR